MGICHDQRFYALRYLPGRKLELPFEDKPFTALIEITVPLSDDILRNVAMDLLYRGMRAALCLGPEAERMVEIVDELVDAYGFAHEARTVYASAHEDEDLAEAIQYFILPTGLAETGLLLVLGGEDAFRQTVRTFGQATTGMREKLVAGAV